VISGYLGVLLALKQFKEQRAFDRQLEWCERTVRALSKLSHARMLTTTARATGDTKLLAKAIDETFEELANVKLCFNEAVLYADQKSYSQLRQLSEKYTERIRESEAIKPSATRSAAEALADLELAQSERVEELLQQVLVELSKPTRKMLRLKPFAK
jgi:hypothetical protein